MNTSTYYNLKLYEGTDTVNPLSVDVPNLNTIDDVMHANHVGVIANATEIKTGSVHAITRNESDVPVFRFTSTSAWNEGDSLTIDGVPVGVVTANGAEAEDGLYIPGASVIGVLVGNVVTILASNKVSIPSPIIADNALRLGGELPAFYAKESNVAPLVSFREKYDNIITAVLETGSTTVYFSDASITTNSLIDVYEVLEDGSAYVPHGFNSIKVENGLVTLTFDAIGRNTTFGIRVN